MIIAILIGSDKPVSARSRIILRDGGIRRSITRTRRRKTAYSEYEHKAKVELRMRSPRQNDWHVLVDEGIGIMCDHVLMTANALYNHEAHWYEAKRAQQELHGDYIW